MSINQNKRYQVFVSSTYEDLQEERLAVLKALLMLDCIPVGMEYFPASSGSQWEYIKPLIAECDYYIVIIGGKYGSTSETGISYTQMEYEYAVERGIPTIGFLHQDTSRLISSKTDTNPEKLKKLEEFKKNVKGRLCAFWNNADDLGLKVTSSLVHEMKHNPRIGWVRANILDNQPKAEEMLALINENTELKKLVGNVKAGGMALNELASDEDGITIMVDCFVGNLMFDDDDRYIPTSLGRVELNTTWIELFIAIYQKMSNEKDASFHIIKNVIAKIAEQKGLVSIPEMEDIEYFYVNVSDLSLKRILLQYHYLGWINLVFETFTLTQLGLEKIAECLVIKKGSNIIL